MADRGKTKVPNIKSGITSEPNTIINDAPNAAPAETPINPGSARGFLNKPCKDAPDKPRLAPTKAASNTLGILISIKTIVSYESDPPLINS